MMVHVLTAYLVLASVLLAPASHVLVHTCCDAGLPADKREAVASAHDVRCQNADHYHVHRHSHGNVSHVHVHHHSRDGEACDPGIGSLPSVPPHDHEVLVFTLPGVRHQDLDPVFELRSGLIAPDWPFMCEQPAPQPVSSSPPSAIPKHHCSILLESVILLA
ncbi:MAG: hypothetical protein ACPGXK_15585 [Phycisphaerae bacterium]